MMTDVLSFIWKPRQMLHNKSVWSSPVRQTWKMWSCPLKLLTTTAPESLLGPVWVWYFSRSPPSCWQRVRLHTRWSTRSSGLYSTSESWREQTDTLSSVRATAPTHKRGNHVTTDPPVWVHPLKGKVTSNAWNIQHVIKCPAEDLWQKKTKEIWYCLISTFWWECVCEECHLIRNLWMILWVI